MVPVEPDDILADGEEYLACGNTLIRKGSVAAFVANAVLIEAAVEGSDEYDLLARRLRSLADQLRAVGVFEVFEVRSRRVADLLVEGRKG